MALVCTDACADFHWRSERFLIMRWESARETNQVVKRKIMPIGLLLLAAPIVYCIDSSQHPQSSRRV
jgi:hypothetical protein